MYILAVYEIFIVIQTHTEISSPKDQILKKILKRFSIFSSLTLEQHLITEEDLKEGKL